MSDIEIEKLINRKVKKIYDFEIENQSEKFFFAKYNISGSYVWICPYNLKPEYKQLIIKNPVKQLENIRKFFFTEFPELKNQLKYWCIGYNRRFKMLDDLSIRLCELAYGENVIKL